MATLIPISNLPESARAAESQARREKGSKTQQLESAQFKIISAAGCYSQAYAPTVGWVITEQAAHALAARLTKMPDGTSHRRLAWEECC